MILKDFIEKFVCKNTLIRLWKIVNGEHEMIVKENKVVCMGWELLNNKTWQSEYGNREVVGVTDIIVNDFYREAINIVINI